jgi:FGGY-family pentulose kinase
MTALLAAIDVGTGSARAGLYTRDGTMVARAERPIETRRISPRIAAQDSGAIWAAVAAALRAARAEAGANPEAIAGVAFDATCSLVFRDPAGAPVGTLPGEADNWDTILWLDHRAMAEARLCDATGHPALGPHGGSMSPEMALPKLLWMKRSMPAAWARTGHIFDLSDFLAWRATGSTRRSLCALTCKWTYPGPEGGWPRDLHAAIGLGDLLDRAGIDAPPVPVGTRVGCLTPEAARDLGLRPGLPVGAGMIDAYAGALGVLGGADAGDLALIGGTSTCVIANGPMPRPVPSGWGPFADVIFPGDWATEVGQSVSGALLGHLTRVAPDDTTTHVRITRRIAELRAVEPDLAPRLQILPDFHGNRSPLGDPAMLGTITGLDMGEDFDSLCRLYWRGSVALALALREGVEHLRHHGVPARRLRLAGGHARSPALSALYADATGLPVVEPECDAVLLGGAMVASVAAGYHPDTRAAATAMARPGRERAPDPRQAGWLDRDWRAFQLMRRHRAELDALLSGAEMREAVPRT